MGRKETLSALVGGMIAFAAYEWQTETAAFFDSIVPNAGYYAVRIIFAIACLYVIGVILYWFYGKLKTKPMEDSKRPYFERVAIDQRYNHVEAKLFKPFYFWWPIIGKMMGKDTDFHRLPRHVLIVNKTTKRAYPPGDFGLSLLHPVRSIDFSFAKCSWPHAKLEEWCQKNGFRFSSENLTLNDIESTVLCANCQNRFVPKGLNSANPVLHVEADGTMYAYTLCPACGGSVRFVTQDNTLGVFVVSTKQYPNRMHEIRVVLSSGETLSREARFYTVSVGVPVKAENALNLKLLYRLLNSPYSNEHAELDRIPVSISPSITVLWNRPEKFLPNVPDCFASALVDGGRVRNMTITAGSNHLNLAILAFFFTIEGADAVFFPSRANQAAIVMPGTFEVELYAEADNKPQTLLKRLAIDARNWESVSFRELSDSA